MRRALLPLILLAWTTGVQAQQPAASPDPRLLAAQRIFEALPETERRAIQQDLTFTTSFSGAASGSFGSLTFGAIQAFEKGKNLVVDGILTPQERQVLAAMASAERKTLRFNIVDDRRSGARIGIPEALLSRRTDNPTGGSRWQSADGKVTLDTLVFGPEEPLPALFEKAVAPSASGRKITYKLLRPDFFVVSGETASGGKFYRRVSLSSDGRMRGFSVGYDKALDAQMTRLVIAVANTFEAFPNGVLATAQPGPVTSGNMPQAAVASSAVVPSPADRLGTGVVLDDTTVLTAAVAVNRCRSIAVGSRKTAGRILALDAALGLALVRTEGLIPQGLVLGTLNPAQPLVALAQSWVGTSPTTVYAEATPSADGKRVAVPLQPGGSGAALYDQQGRLVALVRDDPADRKQIAGLVPLARYGLVASQDITAFLEKNSLTPAKNGAMTTVTSAAADRRNTIVPLHCLP
jgi:peptidoglycan hydrolase-like protein with peptidoglycan-binding domain